MRLLWALNVAAAVQQALLAEVIALAEEARNFVLGEDHFENLRAHDRFSRYCDEKLAHGAEVKASAHAKATLQQACVAEVADWDAREHLRDEEVGLIDQVLELLSSPAVAGTSFLQVGMRRDVKNDFEADPSPVNASVAEQQAACHADIAQLAKLKATLERRINQTATAVDQVSARLDASRSNATKLKHAARGTIKRISGWDKSYSAQTSLLATEETGRAARERAVSEAVEMLQNFYAQRASVGTLSQFARFPGATDAAWPSDWQSLWPDAPEQPQPYKFHAALGGKLVTVLQELRRVLGAEVAGTKQEEEAVTEEARRVRGFRGRAAHESRERLEKLHATIAEEDQARALLQDRMHTEQQQLDSVLEKETQLKELCDKVHA
jgi:hypothetical protein